MSRFEDIFNKAYRTMLFLLQLDVYVYFTKTVQNILFKTTINCFLNNVKTLPKALRTQALTALTSNFGLVGLVRWIWLGRFGLVGLVWVGLAGVCISC